MSNGLVTPSAIANSISISTKDRVVKVARSETSWTLLG